MKFVINRDRLMASIQDVMKAISARVAIPILTGMKLEVKKHGITLLVVTQTFRLNHLFLLKKMIKSILKT